ncbi:MAG: hypothetical protein F9K40_07970 [Kofleriaceae bacterium]|nr:MAG: hypothetical protein F9K40_07970 [Kofleriaceae bacterium]MBZ0231942.1 hypothetical protein [Kofleriaceae bacterium]
MSKPETPKTDAPKTDSTADARDQKAAPRAPWDIPLPFTLPTPEAFTQMMRDQIARTQGLMDELAVYESVAMQRARTAVNDLAKLATDSIGYMAQLSAEWRKLALEAGRRATDAFAPKN